jgi:hypothetical protein
MIIQNSEEVNAKQCSDDGDVAYELHNEKLKHKNDYIRIFYYHHSVK